MCTSEGRQGCLDDSSTCTCRSSNQRPVAAFIIFNDDSVALNILREYNSISWIRYILGGHRFRMNTIRDKQQYSLHVKAAPDPSSIIWENLKYTNVSHAIMLSIVIRLSLSGAVALLVAAVPVSAGLLLTEELFKLSSNSSTSNRRTIHDSVQVLVGRTTMSDRRVCSLECVLR